MAEEEYDFGYKDISELKKGLQGTGKKDISNKEFYDAVQKLTQTISDMLEVFGAAAEQMKIEEREHEMEAKKQEMIISKLDKLVDQNKTIAEGMVAIVEMFKEKIILPAKEKEEISKPSEEPLFKPKPFMEPRPFKPMEWQPRPEPAQRTQPIMMQPPMQQTMPPIAPQMASAPDFGMPPIEPMPPPDLDLEEPFPLDEEPKKKGLFGMFKK